MEAILSFVESLLGGAVDFDALLGGIDLEAIKGVLDFIVNFLKTFALIG